MEAIFFHLELVPRLTAVLLRISFVYQKFRNETAYFTRMAPQLLQQFNLWKNFEDDRLET